MKVLSTLLKIFAAFALVGVLAFGVVYYVVFNVGLDKDPEGKFDRDAILQSLSGETRVYYRDGEKRLGAFFDANHRIYVPYGDIPENIVNALVAAEDARFFEHHGFDLKGFLRAMFVNVKAGSLRQGGSTLTQQTVKNIFGREERSVMEKVRELRDAIRLERHFTKEQILEFYLNQFHVAGSGKGVAIAAQYFFNKDLSELSLAECAFIAGSVKGPFNYDPFAQRNEERKARALKRGEERVKYVLSRMLEDNYISKEEYEAALAKPLAFEHGAFRYSVSTSLALIEEKLNSEFFQDIFEREGIEDWRRAQLKIISTIDADFQDAAKRALQANISDLQLRLGGFALPSANRPNRALEARIGDYLYGALDSVAYEKDGSLNSLYLSFGQIKGVVERSSLDSFEKTLKSKPEKILSARLGKGSILLVSVLDSVAVNGYFRCKLETEPVLQGAIVALRGGEVLASQGGFHNTDFDRSFKAIRQFGSSWKPLLFALAFQYGWNYLDEIENDFNVFPYGNQFYFPRPDHKNKGNTVSIAWAATRSENIASIWLLDHLFDKLSNEEFAEVAEKNNYLMRAEEDNKKYFERLRDSLGLILLGRAKEEIQFEIAKEKFVQKVYAENKPEKARAAMNLLFGAGTETAKKTAKTKALKEMLSHNYRRYENILRERRLAETDSLSMPLPPMDSVKLYENFSLADFLELSLLVEPVNEEVNYLVPDYLRYWPDFRRSLAMADFARFLHEIGIRSKLQKVQSMVLGANEITLAEMTVAYESILGGTIFKGMGGEWSEPILIREIKNREGKTIFKNEIETKRILSDTVTSQMAAILHSVFENGTARSQYANLSVVSKNGLSLRFPAMGKTGTTNDFRNVAFLGALPEFIESKNGFAVDSVLAIGSYVGFDNNKPMKSGKTRIAGSSGGLPQWSSFAKEILKIRRDAEHVDFSSIQNIKTQKVPLVYSNLRGDLKVDGVSGLALKGSEEGAKTLPWLEVPGFVPPQMQEVAAEAAAAGGFITALPMPVSNDSVAETLSEESVDTSSFVLPEENLESEEPESAFVPIEVEF